MDPIEDKINEPIGESQFDNESKIVVNDLDSFIFKDEPIKLVSER